MLKIFYICVICASAGIAELELEGLDPLRVPEMVMTYDGNAIGGNVTLRDTVTRGISNLKVLDIRYPLCVKSRIFFSFKKYCQKNDVLTWLTIYNRSIDLLSGWNIDYRTLGWLMCRLSSSWMGGVYTIDLLHEWYEDYRSLGWVMWRLSISWVDGVKIIYLLGGWCED